MNLLTGRSKAAGVVPTREGLFRAAAVACAAAGFMLAASASGVSALAAAAGLSAGALAIYASARRADGVRRDPMTDLPGRAEFRAELERRLAQAAAAGESLTLMSVALRRLRDVNAQLGHESGDAMLRHLRDMIAERAPPGAFLARVGGGEFALLAHVPAKDRAEIAGAIADSMRYAPGLPASLPVEAFVGVASCGDGVPFDARELLRRADVAMSQGKARDTAVTVYTETLSPETSTRKRLLDDFRHALAHGGLHVNYQPLFDIDGATIIGAETLVRWNHPQHGSIAPPVFVGLAEQHGLIDQLGEFVLRRACRDARDWPDNLFVAVNVSPVQFLKPGFLEDVARILDETGLPTHRLELELTETAIVADEAKAEDMIIELRASGVRMALDDFGTGYSSLIYLRRFAFDKIKIDRSFLEALEPTGESAIIVESMVHLGRSLGLTVTAEGVETLEQLRFLQAIGCRELQGYLLSRPLALEAFHELLAASAPRPEIRRSVA